MRVSSPHAFAFGALAVAGLLLPSLMATQAEPKPSKPAPRAEATPARQSKTRAAQDRVLKPEADEKNQPVTVDADRMESLKKEGVVIFTGNVAARQNNSVQYADRMEVYLDDRGERVLRTVSTGNVRIITRDCRLGTARRGEYDDLAQRVVLIGNARVWQGDNVVTGERITIYLAEERSVVEAGQQERVKAVFFPKSEEQKKGDKAVACR